jgi:hypothetical protein
MTRLRAWLRLLLTSSSFIPDAKDSEVAALLWCGNPVWPFNKWLLGDPQLVCHRRQYPQPEIPPELI